MKAQLAIKKLLLLSTITFLSLVCKKSPDNSGGPGGGGGGNPTDPPTANTIGFFLNDWLPKSFSVPAYADTTIASSAATTFVTIDPLTVLTKVPSSVFGQNANIWMTQMV